MPTLETPRLVLRDVRETDFAAIQGWAGNIDNIKYMTFGPNSEGDTRAWIAKAMKSALDKPRTEFHFAVTLQSTGEVIGTCGIDREKAWYADRFINGSVGWILHMDYWKQGYGTELAGALLRFGFGELGLHRIHATCDAENYGSRRVMERSGMRREAVLREKILARDGTWHDQYDYAMLNAECLIM